MKTGASRKLLADLVRSLMLQSVDNNYVKVMFICGEWGSRKGGISTFNRQLAANLAKTSNERIKVHCYQRAQRKTRGEPDHSKANSRVQ